MRLLMSGQSAAAVIAAARIGGEIRAANLAGVAAAPPAGPLATVSARAGASASAARAANAATSMTPATMPAVVRTSWKPNSPVQTDGQSADDAGPAAGGQHGQREAEGGDHLQQEQPADGRDRPVTGQVQVDRPGGEQQAGTCYPQRDGPPVRSRWLGVFLSGLCGCRYLCLSGRRSRRGIASVRSLVVLVVPVWCPCGSVPVASAAGARWGAAGRGAARAGDLLPQPTGRVQAVALVLPGGGVADEGVQRVSVECGLG
jgi:hypothetical protein